jgi:pimeloyl-ACP methyl ester carboxylesterase
VTALPELQERVLQLSGGPGLSVRGATGDGRPYLLVHGLASNALLWEPVARRLSDRGHEVVAVDLRGHGRSDRPADGYTTGQAALDLAELIDLLGWTGTREPVVCGQSWGANVVLELAARHQRVHAVGAVDGGWLHLADRFTTFDECWDVLAPPDFDGLTWDGLERRIRSMVTGWPPGSAAAILGNLEATPDGGVRNRLSRDHHRSILHSLWADDPLDYLSLVTVPSRFLVAGDERSAPDKATAVTRVVGVLPGAEVHWYPGAHHDLHLQHPDAVTADLLHLLDRTLGEGP